MASFDPRARCALRSEEPVLFTNLREFREIVRRILELNAHGERTLLVAKKALDLLVELDPNTVAFSAALEPFRHLLRRMEQELPSPGATKLTMMELYAEFATKHQSNMAKVELEPVAKEHDLDVTRETEASIKSQEEWFEAMEGDQRCEKEIQTLVRSRSSSDITTTDSSQVNGQSKPMDKVKIKFNVRTEPLSTLEVREKGIVRARLVERRQKAVRGVEIEDDWIRILVKWTEKQEEAE
ncbi:hypothetical protein BC567DRAFT_260572 [Phyllosticta citribraziliensis]